MMRLASRALVLLLSLFISFTPKDSFAVGIDFLGDVTKPLFGEAKDKAQGVFKYIWLQPYGGYAMGSGQTNTIDAAGTSTTAATLSYKGFGYGVRGGLELSNTFRIGADYTRLPMKRDETVPGAAAPTSTEVDSLATMLGLGIGFDIPSTPVQVFGAYYLESQLHATTHVTGKGFGGGISFMLVNPFILIAEYRKIDYTSVVSPLDSTRTEMKLGHGFIALSFLLL